jgi:hypothetical protein
MLRLSFSLWFMVVATIVSEATAASEEWTIFHSFGGDFTRRGVLQWNDEEESSLEVHNDEESLSPENIQAMLDYGWYHVKIETADNDYVLATVPACHLRRANFKDDFQITLPRNGSSERQITSLSYTPLVSPLAPKSCDDYDDDALFRKEAKLLSKARVELDTPGMPLKAVLPHTKPPPGLAFIANPNTVKLNAKGSAGGGAGTAGGAGGPIPGEEAPKGGMEGFLRKYWYVLLPLFLANFMGGGGEAPKAEGEGGGASAGDAAAPAAAIAASGGSPSKKGRRGKKG